MSSGVSLPYRPPGYARGPFIPRQGKKNGACPVPSCSYIRYGYAFYKHRAPYPYISPSRVSWEGQEGRKDSRAKGFRRHDPG